MCLNCAVSVLRALPLVIVFMLLVRPASAQVSSSGTAVPPQASLSPYDQSDQLRLQIESLRAERAQYGIAGPIVMLAAGGGVALTAAYLYLVSSLFEDLDCYDYDQSCNDNSGFRTAMVVVGAAGVVVGVFGLVKLQSRLQPRRELAAQINAKRAELKAIEHRLRLGAMVGPFDTRGVTLALTF